MLNYGRVRVRQQQQQQYAARLPRDDFRVDADDEQRRRTRRNCRGRRHIARRHTRYCCLFMELRRVRARPYHDDDDAHRPRASGLARAANGQQTGITLSPESADDNGIHHIDADDENNMHFGADADNNLILARWRP